MAKKNLSLDEKFENSSYNFSKRTILFMIVPIIIILIGTILFCSINFNLGIDFTGGSSLTVYTNSEKKEEFSESGYDLSQSKEYSVAKKLIKDALKGFNISADSYQTVGMTIEDYAIVPSTGVTNAIVVKYRNSSEDVAGQNSEIRSVILESFGYDKALDNVFVVSGEIGPSLNSEFMMRMAIALVASILIVFIYMWIRFNLQGAFATLLAMTIDVLTVAGLIAILRIEITPAFLPALFGVLILSVISSFVIVTKIKEHLKVALSLGQVNNEEIINKAIKSNLLRNIIIASIFVVASAIVMVFGGLSIAGFLASFVIGVVMVLYTSTFIMPSLWAMVYRPSKRKLAKAKEKAERKDQQEEYQV